MRKKKKKELIISVDSPCRAETLSIFYFRRRRGWRGEEKRASTELEIHYLLVLISIPARSSEILLVIFFTIAESPVTSYRSKSATRFRMIGMNAETERRGETLPVCTGMIREDCWGNTPVGEWRPGTVVTMAGGAFAPDIPKSGRRYVRSGEQRGEENRKIEAIRAKEVSTQVYNLEY